MYFEFKNSVKIIAGDDALSNLSYELKLLDCRKPLFLTDAILEKLGTLDIVRKELKDIDNSKVYSDIPVDSSIHTIEKIKEFYSKNSCDGIIAVGGITNISLIDVDESLPYFICVTIVGILAVFIACLNIFGGFFITHRMLKMFK